MILQGTQQALAVSFHGKLPEPYTCTELIIPFNQDDADILLKNLGVAWETLKSEADNYSINILAKYAEYSKPAPSGLDHLQPLNIDESHFGKPQAA